MAYPIHAEQLRKEAGARLPSVLPNHLSHCDNHQVRETLRGEPAADKKKSDDNGGEGVPEGVKKFDPKQPNGDPSGDAVDIATVEKPKDPKWDNGFCEKAAKRFNAQRHVSLADLGTKLSLDPAKERRRIRQLIIGGHGNRDMLATGSGDGPDVSDELNLKVSNKSTWLPYFNSGKFYGKADIWILSCNVGNGSIPQLMADQSGSTVYAYTRTAYSTEKTPWETEKGT